MDTPVQVCKICYAAAILLQADMAAASVANHRGNGKTIKHTSNARKGTNERPDKQRDVPNDDYEVPLH